MRIMTVRQLVTKTTQRLAREHATQIRRVVNEEDRADARMVLRLAENAFPKTKDYIHFMDLNGFLHDVAAESRTT